MILYDHFKIWLRIFYWSGLAPFPKIDEKLRCYPFIFSVLVYLFINISLIVFSMIFKFYDSYGNIATIVNCAYTVSLSLTNICANVQCYNHKAIYRKIIRRIEKIENNFNNKFSKNISFDTLANRYKLQILVVFGFLFIISLFKFYESWLESGYQMFIISALTILTQCMSVLVLLHTILYIHIVQQFLYELNERIRKAPICFYPSSKIEFLKTVEIIYMDVYKLMMQINSFFSSSLPLLVVHLAIHVTYYFYWIFLILQVEWNLLYITELVIILLYGLVKLSVLVNSCEFVSVQASILMESTFAYAYRIDDDIQLYKTKNEIIEQIKRFPIIVTADGYFNINRPFLAGVALNCCTYIIIFVQFYLQSDKNK